MFKRTTRWIATGALVVAALAGCSEAPGPTEVSAPTTAASPYDTGLTIQTAMAYVQQTGATLATTESESFSEVATAIIGREGGTLRAGDHTLVIPPRAVIDDTWFRMEVVPGANILVDLSAFEFDDGTIRHNEPVNVFRRVPLTLILSYENVLSNNDVDRLRNVYLFLDSPRYMIPLESTINFEDQTISSPIEHFSRYGMAIE